VRGNLLVHNIPLTLILRASNDQHFAIQFCVIKNSVAVRLILRITGNDKDAIQHISEQS
jgi:hypothetical protein